MNRRVVLLIALLLVFVVAFLAMKILNQPQEEVAVEQPLQIIVAAYDIPAGTLIKESDLKWQNWPAEAQTEMMIANTEFEKKNFTGTVMRSGVRAGEPIMKSSVLRPGEQGFLAAVLEPGKRAISVKVTPVTGVAGLAFPGDRVDVLLTHTIDTREGEKVTTRRISETVVTDVRVLAIDQKTDDQAKEPKVAEVATLEVSPKDAEKVALMGEWGTLSLVLRPIVNENQRAASAPGQTDQVDDIVSGLLLPSGTLKDNKATHTWDSDVSLVLPAPRFENYKVRVMHGKETEDRIFDER